MSSDTSFPELVTGGPGAFIVASYEVGVRRSFDAPDRPQTGLSRILTISSPSDDTIQTNAEVWFSPFDIWNQGPKSVGWVFTSNVTTPGSIAVLVSFPLNEFDMWFDILESGQQTLFEYLVMGPSGDGSFYVDTASLSTGRQTFKHSAEFVESRRQVQKN
jgi:hypothetical protein